MTARPMPVLRAPSSIAFRWSWMPSTDRVGCRWRRWCAAPDCRVRRRTGCSSDWSNCVGCAVTAATTSWACDWWSWDPLRCIRIGYTAPHSHFCTSCTGPPAWWCTWPCSTEPTWCTWRRSPVDSAPRFPPVSAAASPRTAPRSVKHCWRSPTPTDWTAIDLLARKTRYSISTRRQLTEELAAIRSRGVRLRA